MLIRILLKDLRRKKGINLILFLFILIATVFLASSVNNMLTVSHATEYFMEKTKIPDEIMFVSHSEENKKAIEDWLNEKDTKVDSYEYQESFFLTASNLKLLIDGARKEFECSNSIYFETNPTENILALDQNGKAIEVSDGEFAIGIAEANNQGLKVGDQVEINSGGVKKTLTLKTLIKESLFVGNMSGMVRCIVSNQDYEDLKGGSAIMQTDQFFIYTADTKNLEKSCSAQEFTNMPITLSKELLKMLYVMDTIVAGVLIIIGICLIFMSVLVLRFTIVFTIEEEYREIGIMKAIGIKNRGIKGLYLIKYLALVLLGAIAGCIISFPVGNLMLKSVSTKMLMENSTNNGYCNILCAVAVILFVLALCYLSMHKLNRISTIDAIRNGQTGERYSKKSLLSLHKSRHTAVPIFLAVNDICSNIRRYVVLLLVFAVGIVLMIVPFNTINTMKSPQMAQQFGMDTKADAYMTAIEQNGKVISTFAELEDNLERVRGELKDKGYDLSLSSDGIMFLSYHTDKSDEAWNYLTKQPVDSDGSYLSYAEGQPPILENEIAMSKDVMEEMGVSIGDSVTTTLCGKEHTFIITGSYQDYMQLGKSVRLNTALDLSEQAINQYLYIQVYQNHPESAVEAETLIAELTKDFPKYTIQTAQEIIDSNVGGIVGIIDSMRIWLIALMAGINILITMLMMKMFLMDEKGQIAMLRSIGFKNRSIRIWQTTRFSAVLLLALVVAIPLSRLMDCTALKSIFGIMGAEMEIHVIPLEVYVLYPGILFLAIVAAALVSSASVKKIDIREMNNLE